MFRKSAGSCSWEATADQQVAVAEEEVVKEEKAAAAVAEEAEEAEEEEEEAGNGVIIAHEKARITGAQLPVATAFRGTDMI